ncbi:MAG: MotA/TolQ/ExbB proton channel family protein [Planctomycetota bacterium]
MNHYSPFLLIFVLLIFTPSTFAQDSIAKTEPPATPNGSNDSVNLKAGIENSTVFEMVFGGNRLGVAIVCFILALSLVSAYFIAEHFFTITRQRMMPQEFMEKLESLIAHGEIKKASSLCHQKVNYSLAAEVILAGLNRYQSSEFGFAEYRSAVEEAGEDQTGKLYRRTEVLHVIGSIAPMLGLTGTVLGMIDAFMTISALEGMASPQQLAGGIGQALTTTLLGLLVAIPSMVAFSYFRNKIDSIVSEAGKRIERIMMPLGRKQRPNKI